MRVLPLCLWLTAVPATAHAGLELSLGAGQAPVPGARGAGPFAHRLVPQLSLDAGVAPLALGASCGSLTEGMAPGERQTLAFILGVFPGFGLGHAIAGSPSWPIWLAVDVGLLVAVGFVFWWGPAVHGAEVLGVLILLVERGFEGYFAYRAAGGRPIASRAPLPESPGLASLAPVPVPSYGPFFRF